MCDFIPALKDPGEEKQFWRGYALAAWALAGLLAVEVIASVWLSGRDGAGSLASQSDRDRTATQDVAKNQPPK